MVDYNKLYDERTKEILKDRELIKEVNKRKRTNLVTPKALEIPRCFDGILNKGEIVYVHDEDHKYWTRKKRGDEEQQWFRSDLRILCITKDTNEGVDENANPSDCGWDLWCESGRNNNCEDIKISATFYKNYMKMVASAYLCCRNATEQDVLSAMNNEETYRHIWEKIPLARINLKKQSGGSSIKDSLLASYVALYKDVLVQQIMSLKANVIICTSAVGMTLLKEIYHLEKVDEELLGAGRDWVYVDKEKEVIVINSYHFSWWANWAETFAKCFYRYCANSPLAACSSRKKPYLCER